MSKKYDGIEFRKPTQATRRFRNQMKTLMKHLRCDMPFPFKAVLHSIYNEHCVIGFHNGNIPYASAYVYVEKIDLVNSVMPIICIKMRYRTEIKPDYDNLYENRTLYPAGFFTENEVMLPNSVTHPPSGFNSTLSGIAESIKNWLSALPNRVRPQNLMPCGLPYLPIINGFAKLKTFVFGAGWEQVGPWAFDWSKPIVFENCRLQWENNYYIPKEEVLKQQHGYSIIPYLVGRTVKINGIDFIVKRADTHMSIGTSIEI